MLNNCQKCHKKPAVTKCIKGKLCTECGKKCHFVELGNKLNQNHPIQYIMHFNSNTNKQSKDNQVLHLRSKSMSCLPNQQALSSSVPKRHTKISNEERINSIKSQAHFKALNFHRSNANFSVNSYKNVSNKKPYLKTNTSSKKILTNLSNFGSNINKLLKKDFKIDESNQKKIIKSTLIQENSDNKMNNFNKENIYLTEYKKSEKKSQNFMHLSQQYQIQAKQKIQQVFQLKKQIKHKDQLIENLKAKLKKQKAINKKIYQNYQEKLTLIRQNFRK